VASALAALSSADRELLMLNACDDLTSAEIAVVLRSGECSARPLDSGDAV